jgi:acetate kinase
MSFGIGRARTGGKTVKILILNAYRASVRVTPEVKRVLGELGDLAPLHNPANLVPGGECSACANG